ncbi:bifunctional diguanylate cyclase/phosphodiesterase [Sutcliffiella deserti]|uniref:bifunctional diguanylate cyclase/phosphodiesterase n=1 Tax=Sutcliffiella deserti TaxID=2875501 RepID=UPI001CBE7D2A|nr:EAL domain-containing protein [Sutcliffiella deserti]
MKMYNLVCSHLNDIGRFIQKHQIDDSSSVFIQMYTRIKDNDLLHAWITEIICKLPHAHLVGANTTGEICNGKISTNEVALSFVVFEKTSLHTTFFPIEDISHGSMRKDMLHQLFTDSTKLVIFLGNGLHHEYDPIIKSLAEHSSGTYIFGAIMGVDSTSGETLMWLNDYIISRTGLIAITFESDELNVYPFTSNSWKEIGTSFSITKSTGNIIKEINNKKPLDFLRKYLGEHVVKGLPSSGSLFPLMATRNGKKTPLFIISVLEDGLIQVDREVFQGETFTFSYADYQGIIDNSTKYVKKLQNKPVESIFTITSMARARYFNDFVQKEIDIYQQIAPTFGFFSYGEIINPSRGEIDYVSFSSIHIALSESSDVGVIPALDIDFDITGASNAVLGLSHLIDASSQDVVELNKSMERSEQRYKSLFDHNTDIVFSIDLFGRILSVNPRFSEIFGFTEKQLLRKSALSFLKPNDVERVTNHFYKALQGIEQTYEVKLVERDGQESTYLIKHIPIIVDGQKAGIYGIGRDITAQKKAEERVAYLAYYDPETALPNRQNFSERLCNELREIKLKKVKQKIAILFIDFDRFKLINDSLGHYVGDELLKLIIERMQKTIPASSYLGRFGGDKFTLLLASIKSIDEVINVAQGLLNVIKKPIVYNDQEFYVTASIGVSMYPNDGIDDDSLLKNADAAMNQAKKIGGNRIKFYSTDMNNQALYRIELESYLRKALEKKEFFLCYQPFVDIQSDKVIGAEALIRWNHPKLGLVSPAEFIPLAEETGLITEIGAWVLMTACQDAKRWQEKGLGYLTISVNVSAHQFQQSSFIDEVKKALGASGLAPSYLQLELTESVMLRNATYSIALMQELQNLGVQISVDDFGTGYSSLSYLRDLPINNLKIDRSFIKNLRFDTKDVAIVNAIVTMGKGLNLKVIAEGIETEEQLHLLDNLSCDVAQGFYLSKPCKVDDFEHFIESRFY